MTEQDTALDEKPTGSDKLRDVHERALRRFDDAVLPQIPVRQAALLARQIAAIPGALWEGDFGDQFDQVVKLDVHKLGRAIRKAETDYRQNRIVPDFRPAGGSSDNDTADTLDGLHRADSQHFKAQQGRDNAFSEACAGGFGAYRLTNEWADPLDKDSDEQRINPGAAIVDADQSVFFDPNAVLYDKSDARFAFVVRSLTPDAFEAQYDDAVKQASWPEGVWRPGWDWFRPNFIAVAEYYEIEERDENVLIFELEATGEEQRHWQKDIGAEEIADLLALGWTERRRKAKRRRCHKYVLSGAEVLEDRGYIAGGNIPIVPVYANRAYVNGVEWFTGLLTSSKIDSARLYASMVSRLAEIQALSPHEKPIFTPEQMPPNLADMWARSNIDRHPYALVNPLTDPQSGQIISAGPIGKVEPPQVPQTLAALLEIANRDVTEDDIDGADEVRANTSADAMDIAAARVDAKSGVLLDNNRQSVQREGELYLAMACEVYVEEGRVVETMTEDGDDGTAVLQQPYYDGDELKTRNDFANGKYKVIASVTEATATRRDRTVKQMLNVATIAVQAQDLEGAQAAVNVATLNMDGEGLDDYLAWQRKRGINAGYVKPNEDEQREMSEAAEQAAQQPDPTAMVAEAQTEALRAGAQRDAANARKTAAEIPLVQAKTVEALANAAGKRVDAGLRPVQAANDIEDQRVQRIRTGAEIADMERAAAMPAQEPSAA